VWQKHRTFWKSGRIRCVLADWFPLGLPPAVLG